MLIRWIYYFHKILSLAVLTHLHIYWTLFEYSWKKSVYMCVCVGQTFYDKRKTKTNMQNSIKSYIKFNRNIKWRQSFFVFLRISRIARSRVQIYETLQVLYFIIGLLFWRIYTFKHTRFILNTDYSWKKSVFVRVCVWQTFCWKIS